MNLLKNVLIAGFLFSIMFSVISPAQNLSEITHNDANSSQFMLFENNGRELSASSGELYDAINTIFSAKQDELKTLGYFSQIYESSLQATYYALYILDAIGKLDNIDQTEVTNYIISHYNETLEIFTDKYSDRYMTASFSQEDYYPYTSLLEINCYAILALDLLGKLNQIDQSKARYFIWDCYNPDTGGFIGQPYSMDLYTKFKITTMDNTYYAILALDALGDDWSEHSTEKAKTQAFIESLQVLDIANFSYGGFLNDLHIDHLFYTLDIRDPNLLSAYYCIKSLDVLGLVETMDYTEFYQYLDKVYDDTIPNLKFSVIMYPINRVNIIASALGVQVSKLSNYLAIDISGVVNFILNNKNPLGLWDSSTDPSYHELMDTFQVIRALSEANQISQLSNAEKDQIATTIKNYFARHDNGFTLISSDYTSLQTLHAIVDGFIIYNKLPDIGSFIQELYDQILSCYKYYVDFESGYEERVFISWVDLEYDKEFRSRPIEYYSNRYHIQRNEIGQSFSHKSRFYALDTLEKMFRLDEFNETQDLNEIVDDIIESQFLDILYSNDGGFLPNIRLKAFLDAEQQNNEIYLEYAYYAMRTLEVIAEFQQVQNVAAYGFDKDKLGAYISKGQQGDAITLYYNPSYTNDPDAIMRNTYYMVYIMNLLDPSSLTSQTIDKINNFVEQNIDFKSIKNVYFSYKIVKLLDLDLEFNFDLTHSLMNDIYSNVYNEFYLTTNKSYIDQEIFLWICDMAKHADMVITASYPQPVELGSAINMSVSLKNIVLDYFGDDVIVKFEGSIGTFQLIRDSNKNYVGEVIIPADKQNYPEVSGDIVITKGFNEIGRLLITIQTNSTIFETKNSAETSDSTKMEDNGQIIDPPVQNALPVIIILIALPSTVIFLSSKSKKKSIRLKIEK